jgi:hypothetical protein
MSLLVWVPPTYAELNVTALQRLYDDATTPSLQSAFNKRAKAFSEATAFSVLQSQYRVKLPGSFRPYMELGFHSFNSDSAQLEGLTTSNSPTPDFFHGIVFRAGLGLPFGFALEGGTTQVVNDHPVTGFFLTASNQILDFAHIVAIDLVPSLTVSGTMMRTVAGPGLYAFAGQMVAGAYNRESRAQFGLLAQYSYTLLIALDPSVGSHFFRYGGMIQLPVYSKAFVKAEVIYPSVTANLSTGLQF